MVAWDGREVAVAEDEDHEEAGRRGRRWQGAEMVGGGGLTRVRTS